MGKQNLSGKEAMEATITLARQIADTCVASPLRSKSSCNNAMNIASMLLDSDAQELALND